MQRTQNNTKAEGTNKRRAVGLVSNEEFYHDEEMERIQNQALQQTVSFAPQNRPWWIEG
jgi:phenylacetate-coenzyme A ligase PaaK-like adenylate-forming protein